MFEIPADLDPAALPLAWMLGRWRGEGVGGYPTIEDFRFGQEVEFGHNGKPFLTYVSRSWLIEPDGGRGRNLATESGFWRPRPGGAIEVLLSHPTGFVEIWLGTIDGAKIELRTDMVARVEDAKPYAAGHRLYGQVEGELMWAFDMAAMDQPMQPHLSARLSRAGDGAVDAG